MYQEAHYSWAGLKCNKVQSSSGLLQIPSVHQIPAVYHPRPMLKPCLSMVSISESKQCLYGYSLYCTTIKAVYSFRIKVIKCLFWIGQYGAKTKIFNVLFSGLNM